MKAEPVIPILLRTSHADVRVTRSRLPITVISGGPAAEQFAHNLIARYTGIEQHGSRAGLQFRRAGVGAGIQVHQHFQDASRYYRWQTQLKSQVLPRIQLTVLNWAARHAGMVPSAASPVRPGRGDENSETQRNLPAPQTRIQPEIQITRSITMRQVSQQAGNLVELVVAQKKRVEMSVNGVSQSSQPAVSAPGRVLRKADAPVADEAAITSLVQQKVRERFDEQKNAPLAQGMPQPPVNINQLADQVIRQIDQRIIAQRERLGKV